MERIIRAIEAVTSFVGGAAALLVVPLVIFTVWEVVARYAFGAPTIWAFELGYTLMGVHFLLGGALALKTQTHVRIDLIYARLSDSGRAWIDLTLYVCLVIPAVVMIVLRFGDYAVSSYFSGETTGQSAWNPPIWPFRAIIVASFVLLAAQMIAECLKCLRAIFGSAHYPRI
jgi:TRAP-type mannitol/chloroaromatic compound transport system permease small subunit